MNNYRTRKLLLNLGINSSMRGFKYILMILPMLETKNKITMGEIYHNVYKRKEAKSPFDVERGIRYAIEKSYKTKKILNKIYGRTPKVTEFLYDLVYNIDIFEEEIKNGR